MPDDELFNSLEERLRNEARGLLGEAPPTPLIADLRDTFVRRRRRRRVVQALGVASAAVLVGLAGVRSLSWHGSESETLPLAAAGAEGRALRREPNNRPSDPVVLRVARDSPAPRPGTLAIGVLIARPGADGKTELVPGVYVPEQTEPIDSRDWSPAERLAVSRLLGPDANLSKHKTI
jgi:hypothetical protein